MYTPTVLTIYCPPTVTPLPLHTPVPLNPLLGLLLPVNIIAPVSTHTDTSGPALAYDGGTTVAVISSVFTQPFTSVYV